MRATPASKTLALSAAEYFRSKLEYETGPVSLKKALEEGDDVFVVDVRGPDLFAQGHIPGARNVPLDTIVKSLASLPKDKTIVTYCADITCGASPRAALELAQKGFRVKHLVGGIAEWSRKGFPVETDAASQAW